MQTNPNQPIDSGYYYIRILGDHDYTTTPEHMENNWTLQDGTVVIAMLEQLKDSDIIAADIPNPNNPREGFPIALWLNANEGTPFEILQPVPRHSAIRAFDLALSTANDRIDELEEAETDGEFELLNSLCEYVNTFGGNPIEYLKDRCREYSLELKA